eukprot:gnl/MRDRNA2_/MRDRNA2_100371_c0_seq1.p1 gnl/MRDRNA2_/MRDRNA2_100371_c0~~gnl/MRDRNA2_/MRDRNA2_100371_c0_seq1.p1  ORF type:complete len:496 (-),score=156.55 gnl/MRDRNA2_/MRDRNA2_100371_c0_seq1:102-1589(-)
MQTLVRLVLLTIFALQSVSAKPKADWKTLTEGLKSKDLVTQVSTFNAISKPKPSPAAAADKAALKANLEDELHKQMAERELKMEAHHDSSNLKQHVKAVMSADKQLKHQMEQQIKEKEVRDKMRHEKALREKLQNAVGSTKKHGAAQAKQKPVQESVEEPLEEIRKAPPVATPRKKLRAPVVTSEPEESEVEKEVEIPRAPPTPRNTQPAASIKVVTASHKEDELPMPSWGPKHDSDTDNGASARRIGGNPWNDVGGKRQHKQASVDDIQNQVDAQAQEEMKVGHLPKLPVARPKKTHRQVVQESEELASHFENGNGIAKFSSHRRGKVIVGAPAPGPGPAPGPVPWTEDPEWMIDGARGDKTRTAPIGEQFKGLASIPQPEQGFHGRPINHEDMETMTGDWGSEFGPKGPISAYKVCKEHPRSYWCKTHMKELSGGEDFGGLSTAKAPSAEDDEEEEEEDDGSGSPPAPSPKSAAKHMSVLAGFAATALMFLAM